MSHTGVIVPISITVAALFAPDSAAITPDLLGDGSIAEPGIKTTHDRDALIQTQAMSLTARSIGITRIHDAMASTIVTPQ